MQLKIFVMKACGNGLLGILSMRSIMTDFPLHRWINHRRRLKTLWWIDACSYQVSCLGKMEINAKKSTGLRENNRLDQRERQMEITAYQLDYLAFTQTHKLERGFLMSEIYLCQDRLIIQRQPPVLGNLIILIICQFSDYKNSKPPLNNIN